MCGVATTRLDAKDDQPSVSYGIDHQSPAAISAILHCALSVEICAVDLGIVRLQLHIEYGGSIL